MWYRVSGFIRFSNGGWGDNSIGDSRAGHAAETSRSVLPFAGVAMSSSLPTYRYSVLALLFSFALGVALPAVCPQSAAHASSTAKAHSGEHSTVPCTAPCHVLEAPAYVTPAPLLSADRFSESPDALHAEQALRAPLFPRRQCGAARDSASSDSSPPVRLHVIYAVFLN